jgi:hypothetical protein
VRDCTRTGRGRRSCFFPGWRRGVGDRPILRRSTHAADTSDRPQSGYIQSADSPKALLPCAKARNHTLQRNDPEGYRWSLVRSETLRIPSRVSGPRVCSVGELRARVGPARSPVTRAGSFVSERGLPVLIAMEDAEEVHNESPEDSRTCRLRRR